MRTRVVACVIFRGIGVFTIFALGIGLSGLSQSSYAHSMQQRIGGYADNQGLTRQRFGYDFNVEQTSPQVGIPLSSQGVTLTLLRDQYSKTDLLEDEYARRIYQSGYRINQTATLVGSQTWARSTDTRQVLTYVSDGVVTTRTFGAGASHWILHDTVRLGFDISTTHVKEPGFRVLDFDSQEVGDPPLLTSSGTSLGLRHLATPTTIVDYSLQGLWSDNRPPSTSLGVGVRQFIPSVSGAVHGTVTRGLNRGKISTDTTYGEIDAWTFDTAYLQSFGSKTHARIGYRYYREDETTRVYRDEQIFGTDKMVLALLHEIPRGDLENIQFPLLIEVALSRYLTNTQLAARSFEVGVTGRF